MKINRKWLTKVNIGDIGKHPNFTRLVYLWRTNRLVPDGCDGCKFYLSAYPSASSPLFMLVVAGLTDMTDEPFRRACAREQKPCQEFEGSGGFPPGGNIGKSPVIRQRCLGGDKNANNIPASKWIIGEGV